MHSGVNLDPNSDWFEAFFWIKARFLPLYLYVWRPRRVNPCSNVGRPWRPQYPLGCAVRRFSWTGWTLSLLHGAENYCPWTTWIRGYPVSLHIRRSCATRCSPGSAQTQLQTICLIHSDRDNCSIMRVRYLYTPGSQERRR